MFSTPCGRFIVLRRSFRPGDAWPSCLDVRGGWASVTGRQVVVLLWRVVAVLVTLWMVVEVVVVEDVGGSRCGCVVSRGSRVVMRRGRGGKWTGWQQWMVV